MWIWIVVIGCLLVGAALLPNWLARSGGSVAGGVFNDGLRACGDSPNCVSSCDLRPDHLIPPISGGKDVFDQLRALIESDKRTKIIESTEDYLHVEFTTPLLRFIDDAEFLLRPDDGRIEIRSVSRLGWSDLGANRRRLEGIRRQLIGG